MFIDAKVVNEASIFLEKNTNDSNKFEIENEDQLLLKKEEQN